MAKDDNDSKDYEIRTSAPLNPYRYILLFLIMGYFPLLIGLFTVCSVGSYLLIRYAVNERFNGIAMCVGIVCAIMAFHILIACFAMFRNFDQKDEWEIELPDKWQAGLTNMVKKVADRGNLVLPDAIRLHAASAAHIYQDKHGDTILVFGAIAVAALSENALASVAAHELAHSTHGDTALARLSIRWHAIMGKLESLHSKNNWLLWNPMAWLLRAYHLFYAVVLFADRRKREYAADQFSVQVIGKEDAAASLVLLELLEVMPWTRMINVAENAVEMHQKMDRLFAEQVRRLRNLSDAEWSDALRIALKKRGFWNDSHPILSDRLKAIGVKQKKALALAQELVHDPDSPSATTLFVNWPVVEKFLTKKVLDIVSIVHAERRLAYEDLAAIEKALSR